MNPFSKHDRYRSMRKIKPGDLAGLRAGCSPASVANAKMQGIVPRKDSQSRVMDNTVISNCSVLQDCVVSDVFDDENVEVADDMDCDARHQLDEDVDMGCRITAPSQ